MVESFHALPRLLARRGGELIRTRLFDHDTKLCFLLFLLWSSFLLWPVVVAVVLAASLA